MTKAFIICGLSRQNVELNLGIIEQNLFFKTIIEHKME